MTKFPHGAEVGAQAFWLMQQLFAHVGTAAEAASRRDKAARRPIGGKIPAAVQ
jgi:hypothetical protein